MTHTRNAPASGTVSTDRAGSDSSRPRQPRVRRKTTLPADGYAGRERRARAEPMAVRPLRDGRYVVESEGGTYVVDAERAACTCPDSAIRGFRCKHVRRVTAEIDAGIIPAPDERERVCAVCGGRAFAPIDYGGPALCDRHDREPGEFVRDRETGALLAVVEQIGERADEVRTGEGRVVADYETNANYGDHELVFATAYVDAMPAGGDRDDVLAAVEDEPRYLFPASRLDPVAVERERNGEEAPIDRETSSRRASGGRGVRA